MNEDFASDDSNSDEDEKTSKSSSNSSLPPYGYVQEVAREPQRDGGDLALPAYAMARTLVSSCMQTAMFDATMKIQMKKTIDHPRKPSVRTLIPEHTKNTILPYSSVRKYSRRRSSVMSVTSDPVVIGNSKAAQCSVSNDVTSVAQAFATSCLGTAHLRVVEILRAKNNQNNNGKFANGNTDRPSENTVYGEDYATNQVRQDANVEAASRDVVKSDIIAAIDANADVALREDHKGVVLSTIARDLVVSMLLVAQDKIVSVCESDVRDIEQQFSPLDPNATMGTEMNGLEDVEEEDAGAGAGGRPSSRLLMKGWELRKLLDSYHTRAEKRRSVRQHMTPVPPVEPPPTPTVKPVNGTSARRGRRTWSAADTARIEKKKAARKDPKHTADVSKDAGKVDIVPIFDDGMDASTGSTVLKQIAIKVIAVPSSARKEEVQQKNKPKASKYRRNTISTVKHIV